MKTAKRNLLRKIKADLEANRALKVYRQNEAGRHEAVLRKQKRSGHLQEVLLKRSDDLSHPKSVSILRPRVLTSGNAVKAPTKRAKNPEASDLEAGLRNGRDLRSENDDREVGQTVGRKSPIAGTRRKDREADPEVARPAMPKRPNWTLLKKMPTVKVATILPPKSTPSLTEKAPETGLAADHQTETTMKKTGQPSTTVEMTTEAMKTPTVVTKSD